MGLPGWSGLAPWPSAQVLFGLVKIWQYDDSNDVRGFLTEDVRQIFNMLLFHLPIELHES